MTAQEVQVDHRDFARTLQCLTLCLRSDSEQSCGWQVALDRAIARVSGEGAHDAAGPAGSANAAAFDDALHAWSTGGPYWPGASMAGRAAELLCGPECWRLIEILEHT